MARRVKRLSARFVETVGKPGRYADGDGLYLIVSPKGAKRWQFLFRWQSKLQEMGLGSQSGLGLLEAREMASEARKILATGRNPIDVRRASREPSEAERTFGQEPEELRKYTASFDKDTGAVGPGIIFIQAALRAMQIRSSLGGEDYGPSAIKHHWTTARKRTDRSFANSEK
jgi:Arm DNA-binding domain